MHPEARAQMPLEVFNENQWQWCQKAGTLRCSGFPTGTTTESVDIAEDSATVGMHIEFTGNAGTDFVLESVAVEINLRRDGARWAVYSLQQDE